ncbi:MAG: cysteine--tRNA ligase, partial [Patescibacteria group bacterium]
HYRQLMNFTWESLIATNNAYAKLEKTVRDLKQKNDPPVVKKEYGQEAKSCRQKLIDAISNDVQTPKALAILWEITKLNIPNEEKLNLILEIDEVLGLNLKNANTAVVEVPEEIKKLAEERETARISKNFSKSDELRKEIEKKGYEIKDTDKGYKISKK